MSKELLAISFFKEKGISYFVDQKKGKINFTCPHCSGTTVMEVQNTYWACSQCSSTGNLVSLFKLKDNEINKQKVFNPREEKKRLNNKINRVLNQLRNQPALSQDIKNIKTEMNVLINRLIS